MLKVYTVSTNGVKSGELETRLGFAAQPADIRDNAMSQSNNEPTFIRINTLLTQEYGRKLVEYLIDEPIAENFVGSIEKGDITYKFTPQLVIYIACTGPEGRVNCNLFGNFLCTVYGAFKTMEVKQYVNSSRPMRGICKGVPLNSPVLWVSIDDFVRSLKPCSADLGADYVNFRNLFYAPVKSRGAVGIRLSNILATDWIYGNEDKGDDIEENEDIIIEEEDDMPDMKTKIAHKNSEYYAPRFEYLAEAYERKYNDLGDMLIAVGIQPSWSSSPFLGVAKVLDAELDSITLDLRPVYAGLPAEIRKDMLDEVNDLPCYRIVTLKVEKGDPDMGWVFTAPNKSVPSISVMLFD